MEQLKSEALKTMLTELAAMLHDIYCDKLKTIILYGSVARGTATDESDIDIAALIDGTDEELKEYEDSLCDISTDLSLKYLKVFSIIDVSYQEFMAWRNVSPFYRNISEEGMVLYM